MGFHWPSSAGSIVHNYGAGRLLVEHGHQVRLICVRFPDKWPRGLIKHSPPFPVYIIDLARAEYTPEIVSERISLAVNEYEPDVIIFGEGWSMKNWVASALIDRYRCLLRFHAYEMLCPFATLYSHYLGNIFCNNDVLMNPNLCEKCFNNSYPPTQVKEICSRQESLTAFEALSSRYFSTEYIETLRRVITGSYCCMPQNRFLADRLRYLGARISIVPHGIYCNEWPVTDPPKTEPFIFFMPGRIDHKYKGLNYVKNAVRALRKHRDEFVVIVTLAKTGTIEPGIESIGLQPQEFMPRLFQSCHVVIITPLWYEPRPHVGIEALASGRPVIGTRIGGMIDLFGESEAGILVEPGNVQELCDAMCSMIDDTEFRLQLGSKARECAEISYDWDMVYEKHYKPLLAGSLSQLCNLLSI